MTKEDVKPKFDTTISFGSILNLLALVGAVGLSWGVMTKGGENTKARVDELVELVDRERNSRQGHLVEERQARLEALRDLEQRLRILENSTARAEARTDEKFNTILQTLSRLELNLRAQADLIGDRP